jgi:hypothetical protein
MPRGMFLVQSSALDDAHEPAYEDWYRTEHIPQVLDVPGFASARRYRIVDGGPDAHRFLTIYEIDTDGDLRAPLAALYERMQSGGMGVPDHVRSARPPTTTLYELTGEF